MTVHFELLNVIIRQTMKSNAEKMRYIKQQQKTHRRPAGGVTLSLWYAGADVCLHTDFSNDVLFISDYYAEHWVRMEALQRLHMSPVGPHSPFMPHHESMLRANVESAGAAAGDRKSPMDTRLVMQVRLKLTIMSFYCRKIHTKQPKLSQNQNVKSDVIK